jgi:transcriptional regulator with XRE-family HTH domain
MERKKPKRGGRHNIQVFTDDIVAIRKMRISRRITRDDAGKAIGVSGKTIERIENGRRNISDERLKQLIRRYRYTLEDFRNIINGTMELPNLPARSVYNKPHTPRKEGRKYQKIISKEARILKSLRKLKGLTRVEAAKFCGLSRSVIDHWENGRVNLPQTRIKTIIESWGCTMNDFDYLLSQPILRDETVEKCQTKLEKLSIEQLMAVSALLNTFAA